MLAPIATMPQGAVTLPVFGSAGAQAQGDGAQAGTDWHMDCGGGDPMDFDLLAEYLLDDNPTAHTAGLNFDFNADTAPSSSVVSPEQSVDGIVHAPPAPPSGVVQAQHIIAQHAAGVHQQHVQQPVAAQQPRLVMAPVQTPAPLAPAPLAPAGAPLSAPRPMVAAHGITISAAPVPLSYAHSATHIAPAPAVSVPVGANTGIPHHLSTAVTKRRRVSNVPAMGDAGPPNVMADPMAVAAALQGRGRKKTQAQIDRRRERNRILARRTRLRKKFFFESLQKEVIDLQRENVALKEIARTQMAEEGRALLAECDAAEKLPPGVLEACGEDGDIDQQDFNLVRSIQQSQHSFIITDPSLQDNPIVFASDDFLSLTGYSREDVLGRNCRFLQGTATDKSKVDEIRKGLSTGDDISVTLVNYTADGTPFWNKLFIASLRDSQSNIVNFIGVVAKVQGPEPGDPEHGKELPGENELDAEEDKAAFGTSAIVADGTVQAIEGVVDAAVAAAPSVVQG